jgi:hypothetical protein
MWDTQPHHAFAVEQRFPELTVNDRDVVGLGESGGRETLTNRFPEIQ